MDTMRTFGRVITATIFVCGVAAVTAASAVRGLAPLPSGGMPEALRRAAIATRSDRHGRIAGGRIDGTDLWIVYIETARGCGSGGCPPQLWGRNGGAFVRRGLLPNGRLPVSILPGSAEGMPTLAVSVFDKASGADALQPLIFDGRRYLPREGGLLPPATGRSLVTKGMLRRF